MIWQTIVFSLFLFQVQVIAQLDTELQLVQILFRHGDRSPVMTYPNDLYNETSWAEFGGFGQLTQTGMNQHHNLGRFLRDRYGSFLNKFYNRENAHVVSTDFDRTLMSAQSLLSGLYEPQAYQMWNKEINWQPIPVHTTNKADDKVFYGLKCPRFEQLKKQVEKSDEYIKINSKYQDLFDIVDANSGCAQHPKSGCAHMSLNDEWKILDCLFVEKTHGFKLPDWVEPIYDQLQHSKGWGFYFMNRLPDMARLQSGGILKDMRKNINDRVNQKDSKRQLFLYSGHDTYVAALTKLLNLTRYINQPSYASAVALELRKEVGANNYFVQAYLKNNTAAESINYMNLTINGCTELCPLEKFMQLTDDLIVHDFPSECKYHEEQQQSNPFFDALTDKNSKRFYTNVSILIVVLVMITSVLIIVAVFKKTNVSNAYRELDEEYLPASRQHL